MALFKDRLASFGKDLKGVASNAKDKTLDTINSVDLSSSMQKVKDVTATAAISSIDYGKEKTQAIKSNILSATENFDFDKLTKKEFYSDKIKEYSLYGTDKVTQGFKSIFEIDKDTNDIINDLREKLPVPPSDISDIFEQCKQEAFSRAVSAFFLDPIISGLDQNSEDKYANLSQKYKDFNEENILIDNPNFAKLKNERRDAQNQFKTLEDGYNSQNRLDPYSADIEHIVSKKEIYDNFILRVATTDDQIIESMNFEDNLIFADASLNRSMQDMDIFKYIDHMKNKWLAVVDSVDSDIIHVDINGKEIAIRESDVKEKYEKAQEKVSKMKIDALKEIGITVASSATKVAIQQVIGLIIVETIDIFVDEIKDMTIGGNFFTAETFTQSVLERKDKVNTPPAKAGGIV